MFSKNKRWQFPVNLTEAIHFEYFFNGFYRLGKLVMRGIQPFVLGFSFGEDIILIFKPGDETF